MTALSSVRRRLDGVIATLCPLIEKELKKRAFRRLNEYELRRELIGCILGSQVRHQMAVTATQNLESAGLLDDAHWHNCENDAFESHVLNVLIGRENSHPGGSYRFPNVRARQLAQARIALGRSQLTTRLLQLPVANQLRRSLIEDIPGLGPKQASMFLRNIGKSYDLAILDSHVLRFIDMQGLLIVQRSRVATVEGYEKIEEVLIEYADTLRYPVGYLDWAIWATMKAAQEVGL